MFTAADEQAWRAKGMLMVPRQYRAAADSLRAQGQEQLAKTAEALIKAAEHWLRERQRGAVPSVPTVPNVSLAPDG
ncbi:MAG: hypothetical protein WCF50_31095 [Pseudolabrys sp.]